MGNSLGSDLSASNIDFGSDGTFYVAVGPPTSGSTQSVELWQYSEGWNSLSPQALGSNSYLPDLYLYGDSPHLTYGGNEENGSYFGAVCYYYDSNDGWCAVRLGDNFYEDDLYPLQALAHTRDGYYSYVAYIANGDLYVKSYFDGWQQMPSSSPAAINVKTVSGVDLALLHDNPVVAYADSGGSLTVMEWVYGVEGYEWQSISPMASEPILIGNSPVRLFVDNNILYLAYVESDQKVSVMQCYDNDGTWDWSYIGNSRFSDPVATGPGTLDLYVEGGVPYIFYKNANDNRGYVMKGPGE